MTRESPHPLAGANRSRFTGRLRSANLLLALLFVALLARVAMIQVADGATYARMSTQQASSTVSIPSLRGAVYDRDGNILAISTPTSMVVADDFQIHDPSAEARALSPLVHRPVARLVRMLSRRSGYVILNNDLSLAAGRRVSSLYLSGIVVLGSSVRSEPNGTIAESLLGGLNAAGDGSAGLEYQYQSLLAGQDGLERVVASPNGVVLPSTSVHVIKRAVAGRGLELTIDTPLQFVAEQALGEQLRSTGAVSGVALVMDVKTGQILADASLVNERSHAGVLGPIPSWGTPIGIPGIQQTVNNLAFSSVYEPGSVFKIVPFSAALDAGTITPSSVFTVPYSVSVGGRTFHDADEHPTERLSATEILARSSNIGTYEISKTVGEAGLLAQVQRLGFGQVTALDFPGESAGLLVNASGWYPSDMAALPIGQVDAVTPIQVLDAYNSIANGGVFVEPKLVRGIVSANGSVVPTPASATHVALSPSVASTLNHMLQHVVLAGTGVLAFIPGYRVAGKTGTSQIPTPDHRSYIAGAYDASFVGFAPADNPVLSMIVIVERPQTTIYGGSVAAPVFQRVMSYALHHYGVPANGPMSPPPETAALIASDVT